MPPRDDSARQLRQRQLLELLRQLADRIPVFDDEPWRTSHDFAIASDHQRIVDEARQSSISFDQPGEE